MTSNKAIDEHNALKEIHAIVEAAMQYFDHDDRHTGPYDNPILWDIRMSRYLEKIEKLSKGEKT